MSLLDSALPALSKDAVFRFSDRPAPLLAMDRLTYRTATLLISLSYCKKNRSTFGRLALLSFSVRSQRLRMALTRVVRNLSDPRDVVVRFDPFFPRVLTLAVANGLVTQESKGAHFSLAWPGARFVDKVIELDAFRVERDFLKEVAGDITEAAVLRILSGVAL